jgi:acyl-CoA thioester hydrolase
MNKIPFSRHRIRFKDCDPLGHLYNTRFIEYMLEAREDQILDNYGLNLMEYSDQRKLAWVLIKHEINYLKEARRGEYVIISSALFNVTSKSLMVEYQMWNENQTQLKALLWSRFLHLDLKFMRVVDHPEDIQELLESLTIELKASSIEERIKMLITQ